MVKKFVKNYKQYFWIGCLLLFIGDYILIATHHISEIDYMVYQMLQFFYHPITTAIFKAITFLGSGIALIGISVVTFFINRKRGVQIFSHLAIVQILNRFVKAIVQRSRPSVLFSLVQETGWSFPSGHTMSATITYIILIHWLYQSEWKWKKEIIFLLFILIGLIGCSRIYLGVHYFSDVFGGMMLSLSYYLFIKDHTCFLED